MSTSLKASTGMEFVSTKTFTHAIGLSCAFRQWRAESHCRFLHGYALQIRMEFTASELDHRNWVVDFGSLKPLKGMIENTLDHKTLVAKDDPEMANFKKLHMLEIIDMVEVDQCGCEAMAYMIYEVAAQWLKDAGYIHVNLHSVEVSEHEANSAIYRRKF